MIVEMKQVILLSTGSDRRGLVTKLRKLGVLHIKDLEARPASEELTQVECELASAKAAAAALATRQTGKAVGQAEALDPELEKAVKEIVAMTVEKTDISRQLHEIGIKLNAFEPWGAFDPADLETLAKAGAAVRLYRVNKAQKKQADALKSKILINQDSGYFYIAVLSGENIDHPEFEEFKPPKESFESLQGESGRLRRRLNAIEQAIDGRACLLAGINRLLAGLEKKKELFSVLQGVSDMSSVVALEGFCPADKIEGLIALAKKEHYGYMIRTPEDPAIVPTLLENPKPASLIKPVFDLMGTLPGYAECDVSFWFLIFFSIFFAMIIGDAGYGLIFLAVTFYARRKNRLAPPAPFFLMYLLSAATIAWGAVTGTWFGSAQIAQLPFFKAMIIDRIYSFGVGGEKLMMQICFLIGTAQLTVAHLIIAHSKRKSLKALAEIGWIFILWSVYFLAGMLVLGNAYPPSAKYLMIAGLALVLLFTHPSRNFVKAALGTIGDLPLKVISAFSDVVSYIRLFAVGYASVVVSSSFNDMALAAGVSSVVSGLLAALIIFFGHALNITLALMAVIVHGIRLNMLEFSGHLGMEWSGKEYKPFSEK